MSGSRLGRGRGGRLAVYGGCGVVVLLLIFLYRAATSEMARLRELHVQCAHQQEALAAQLQVIFEYKVRLEKSLAEEKSSNAAVKQELQQRASREKSLRDKDSIEAMQRFNSLQQTYKILQTEHQDLQGECKKREKQALEETTRLETTLQDLRSRIRQAREDKEKALEHLKNQYLVLDTEKTKLEEKYNEMLRSNGNTDSTIQHLKKEVFQLKRELDEAKKSSNKVTSSAPSLVSPQSSQLEHQPSMKIGGHSGVEQPNRLSQQQQQQVSRPNNDDKNPHPLDAPRAHHAIGDPLSNEETNEFSNVRFAQKNGNIVPVGPNDLKDPDQRDPLPLPYDLQERRKKNREDATDNQSAKDHKIDRDEDLRDDQPKQVISPPNQNDEKNVEKKSSPNPPKDKISLRKQNVNALDRPVQQTSTESSNKDMGNVEEDDELQKLQVQVDGILNQPSGRS